MFRVVALCAFSMLLPAIASAAEDTNSANWVMPGCRVLASNSPQIDLYKQGVCNGAASAIVDIDPGVCPPPGSTRGQNIRVVARYIDERPSRLHEPSNVLGTEALRAAWPCRR